METDEQPPEVPRGQFSVAFGVVFYTGLAFVAWLLAEAIGGIDLLIWHDDFGTSTYFDAALGAGVGVGAVALSRILERTTEWAQQLAEEFGKLLGPLGLDSVLLLAVASGIAEEVFFRGFLQQLLSEMLFGGPYARVWGLVVSGVVFGLLHVGPDVQKFLPWTIMALIFGGAFGGMYWYTGNLLAPVLAHFTINFLNLNAIARRYGGRGAG
ncbi:MAG: lysostaphin resistance A-like protein [Bradymonadaceae bacterium]